VYNKEPQGERIATVISKKPSEAMKYLTALNKHMVCPIKQLLAVHSVIAFLKTWTTL
jgi:hypothetical protein